MPVLASLVAGACLAATLVAPAPSAADEAPVVRAGSFNLDRDRDFDRWRGAVVRFRRQVDVAGLQEVSTRAKRRYLAAPDRWGYFGATPGPDENPVIWDRRDFRATGTRSARIARGAFATVVRLRHRGTGAPYAVLNVHLVWGSGPAAHRARVAQLRGLARVARHERAAGARVLVVGDFNVDHRVDRRQRRPGLPVRRLGSVGLISAWESAVPLRRGEGSSTLGAGFIDNVWAAASARSMRALRRLSGGQHHPVVATYAVGEPTRRQHPAE